MTKKVALITGVTGQDGAYLAEFLIRKGYEVHGIKRRTSLFNTARIEALELENMLQVATATAEAAAARERAAAEAEVVLREHLDPRGLAFGALDGLEVRAPEAHADAELGGLESGFS